MVVKYSPDTFAEVDRVEVGEDPHVTLTAQNDALYVATRAEPGGTFDEVTFLQRVGPGEAVDKSFGWVE